MVLWYMHTYIKLYYSFTHMWWSNDILTSKSNPTYSFMHTWWSYDICKLISNLVYSSKHMWWSYDISTRISNPIYSFTQTWWFYDICTLISNPTYSFTQKWWSYDIRTCISKSIIPSSTRDGFMIDAHVYQTLFTPSCKRDSFMIYAYLYQTLPIPSRTCDGLMIYAHIYQTLLFLHAHLMVLWYTPMYIKIFQSVMHTWWSYDIRTRISNPIIPSRTCDGLMIYAHVYQHPGIYWTCERFRRLDSTLLVPAGKGLSIRTPEGSTVWHLHRQHGGI